jgi:hypothetical protein
VSIEIDTESTGPVERDGPRDLEFEVLGARPVKYAAAPMLALDLQVT